jgi:hypothetical protein
LYVNVITALESYVADFLTTRIKTDRSILHKFVESNPDVKTEKFTFSEVFEVSEAIEQKVNAYLSEFVWHRFDRVRLLFKDSLGVKFLPELGWLLKAVIVRHDIVHRNGKGTGGMRDISEDDVRRLAQSAQGLVDHIEKEWSRVSSPFQGRMTYRIRPPAHRVRSSSVGDLAYSRA